MENQVHIKESRSPIKKFPILKMLFVHVQKTVAVLLNVLLQTALSTCENET